MSTKKIKELKRLIKQWREYADGHYCQTYNPGKGQGLRTAANDLEEFLRRVSAEEARG